MHEDIRDLLGRFATGSLSAEEQKRLCDAALDDQDLFDQLAREQDLKRLLDEPGARDRMIRALAPPKRKIPWVLAWAPIAIVTALVIVFVMRPAPKPRQVAVVAQAPPPAAPIEAPRSQPEPVAAPSLSPNRRAVDRPKEKTEQDEIEKAAPPKQMDQPVAAPQSQAVAAPQSPQLVATQQARAPASAGTAATVLPAFGFHYSIETKGHLIVIPLADGYLSVKSNAGTMLFAQKPIAAGITIDIPLPDAASSVSIAFSENATPPPTPSPMRTAVEDTVRGATGAAITLRLHP